MHSPLKSFSKGIKVNDFVIFMLHLAYSDPATTEGIVYVGTEMIYVNINKTEKTVSHQSQTP